MNEHQENQAEGSKQQEVPQLNEITGVSFDYRNNYVAFIGLLELRGIGRLLSMIRERGFFMEKYEERFPPSKYRNVVNEKNRSAVKRIDELADSFNQKVKDDTLTEKDFGEIYHELEKLILGE